MLLLCLFLHAFLVSATHYHRIDLGGPEAERAGVSVSSEGGAQRAAEAGGHTQCLLCRFQRDLFTDFRKQYVPGGPGPQAVLAAHTPPSHTLSDSPFSMPSGRAPPLA